VLADQPLWYKDAVVYQLHVRGFRDRVGDGTGDLRGLTEKLDYLQDLGVTAIWLLPFYPSPLKDDGYDIADYTDVHPDYGTLRDFERFLQGAHARGMRVITELVLNHTSDRHAWFQRARNAPPGSPERDFYVWSDTPDKYHEARIIFQDFEPSNWTWDPVARAYYWHRFYSHQPDLNYDNPEVLKAIFPVVDFWLEMGVDGMRLDAVPYLFEREGTSCENLPETHAFLKALRKHVDEKFKGRMLLAEANQWPEDAVAYFGGGDEAHMAFHFPLMPRMFMAVHTEDRLPIVDVLEQTPPIPGGCQWATFLRNHDELTLEMVTDEERDYMYRAYANDPKARINAGIRRRLAPLLGNSRRKIELMNGLLLSLPGTPVLYYGDEIGMGDNIYLGDRNGVRTPMQWSADRNAGFSRANPQQLYLPLIIDPAYHYETVNVEAQQGNPSSLLWWMKRFIGLRRRYRAFGRGTLEFLHPANRKVLAFLRRHEEEAILVVANLSRFVQYAELDLSSHDGETPVELFARTPFPAITKQQYFLTLAPHGFYWFLLQPKPSIEVRREPTLEEPETIEPGSRGWQGLFEAPGEPALAQPLLKYLGRCEWFGENAAMAQAASIQESIRVPYGESEAFFCQVLVEFREGIPERYSLPIARSVRSRDEKSDGAKPGKLLARLEDVSNGFLHDALEDEGFRAALLDAIKGSKRYPGIEGEFVAWTAPGAEGDLRQTESLPPSSFLPSGRHNTILDIGRRWILKVFRCLGDGVNPELEVGRFLTVARAFPHAAPLAGAIEYRRRRSPPLTLAVLHRFVPNAGDAWQFTLDDLGRFFERALAARSTAGAPRPPDGSILELSARETPAEVRASIDTYLEMASLLGKRTAELHTTLASETHDPDFAPDTYSPHYQRSVYQSMRILCGRVFQELRQALPALPEAVRAEAVKVLALEGEAMARFRSVLDRPIDGLRIRCHGNYGLSKVLYTGKDLVITDFEGNPERSMADRRLKRSPLRDVVSMIRSFHDAAYSVLCGPATGEGRPLGVIRPEDVPTLEPWAFFWYSWVSAAFLKGYLETAAQAGFLPRTPEVMKWLFEAFLVEKALVDIGSDLSRRRDRLKLPLLGALQMLYADRT